MAIPIDGDTILPETSKESDEMANNSPFPLPRTWRSEIPFRVHDQKTNDHCMIHALVAYLEAKVYLGTGRPIKFLHLSVEHLIDTIRSMHPEAIPPIGHRELRMSCPPVWSMEDILDLLGGIRYGAVTEEDYARVGNRLDLVSEDMVRIRVNGFNKIDLHLPNAEGKMHELFQNQPLIIIFPLLPDFDALGTRIYDAKPWPTDSRHLKSLVSHATLMTGQFPRGYFGPSYSEFHLSEFLNCHGPTYGNEGFGVISNGAIYYAFAPWTYDIRDWVD